MFSQVYHFLGEEMGYGLAVTTQSGLQLNRSLASGGITGVDYHACVAENDLLV